jgi:hypothetical protein
MNTAFLLRRQYSRQLNGLQVIWALYSNRIVGRNHESILYEIGVSITLFSASYDQLFHGY